MAAATKYTRVDQIWLRTISPLSWPVWLRRMFILTVPISVPLYLMALVILVVITLVTRISEPITEFWNTPQRKLRSNFYYAYNYEERRKRAELDDQEEL